MAATLAILLAGAILAGEFVVVETLRFRATVLGLGLALALWPPDPGSSVGARGRRLAAALAATLALGLFGLIAAESRDLLARGSEPSTRDVVIGVLVLALVVEGTRRAVGAPLAILAALSVAYVLAGNRLDAIGLGVVGHRGYDLARLVGAMVIGFEGVFGVPLDVAATTIGLFAIYGAVLERTGAADFYLEIARALFGGGTSARAAGRSVTFAGFLLGAVSGSGVATTLALGGASWPLLRRAGFTPEKGGAILAAAGIGAILSPPTMGAAAFLIAEFLQISYGAILVMAIVPTLLYYAGLALMIEVDARETGGAAGVAANGDGGSGGHGALALLRARGFHLVSPIAIVGFLVSGTSATRAALYATGLAAALSFLDPSRRLDIARARETLVSAGGSLSPVVVTTAAAGILVGALTLTGLGLKLAGLIVAASGGERLPTILLSGLAVSLLGLSVPVTASYILSAVMVVPALTDVGVSPFAAHMFVFYYAVLSEVSPPTALAPMAAATLTGGHPRKTMFATWRATLPAFLTPILFTAQPEGAGLLLRAGGVDAVIIVLVAAAAIYAATRALDASRSTPERVLDGLAALLLVVGPGVFPRFFAALALGASTVLGRRRRR